MAARRRWGFAELEALRVEHGLSVSRFCQIVGLPARTYYDRRARHHAGQAAVRGPWPMPARDRVREQVIAMALAFPMWGHRKIAWLCRHDATAVSDATCLRVLRDAGLVLPVDYVRERRDLAKARREAFVTIPTRRNRVWQTDFFELETSGGARGARATSSTTRPNSCSPARSPRRRRPAMRSAPSRTPAARSMTCSAGRC